jgi:hypothetical protein
MVSSLSQTLLALRVRAGLTDLARNYVRGAGEVR